MPARNPPSRDYLRSQQWTAERVRRELIDELYPSPRYEFIDGALIVTPSPDFAHQLVVTELLVALHGYLAPDGLGQVMTSPSDVEVAANTVAQPDVYVVPVAEALRLRGQRDPVPVRSLLLAIEIVSPSSVRTDRLRKRRFYTGAGVPEYWVVDPEARVIERSVAGDPRVEIVDATLRWRPERATADFALDVAAFFERVLGPLPDDAD